MRVLILGSGFGGLELAASLSNALGDRAAVKLIDKSDSFIFGYSKLDVVFGKQELAAVRIPYRAIAKPGVTFCQETISDGARYEGAGVCYIEFGRDRVGRVDVNFLGGPSTLAALRMPSRELRAQKTAFGSIRRLRWFGLDH